MWLVADDGWAGPGRRLGTCAVPVAGPARPVQLAEVPEGEPCHHIGGTLLPGLRDAHAHLTLIDPFQLANGGIAAADDLGGNPAALSALQERSRDPDAGLPEIRFAGAFLTAPSGYPHDRSWAPPGSWRAVRSVDDAELAAADQFDAGATCLKIALNATAGPVLSLRILRGLAEAAQRAGHQVVAHVEGPGMLELALDAGISHLAHTPWTEPLDPGLVAAAATEQTWISTLAIHGSRSRRTVTANLAEFLAAGGRVTYGTDLGNGPLPNGINAAEVRALQAAGLGVDDVLAAMTGPGGQLACHLPGELPDAPGLAESLRQASVLTPAHVRTLMHQEEPR